MGIDPALVPSAAAAGGGGYGALLAEANVIYAAEFGRWGIPVDGLVVEVLQGVGVDPIRGGWNEAIRRAVYEAAGGKCWLTGRPIAFDNFHIDHAVPHSHGGSSIDLSNLRAADPAANIARRNAIEVFVERHEGVRIGPDGRLVPDNGMRLIERNGEFYNIRRFSIGGAVGATVIGIVVGAAVETGIQAWDLHEGRREGFDAVPIAAAGGIGGVGALAGWGAGLAIANAATPVAFVGLGAAGATPVAIPMIGGMIVGGVVAGSVGELVRQSWRAGHGNGFDLTAVGKGAASPAIAAYELGRSGVRGVYELTPKRRKIRSDRRRWASVRFIPDYESYEARLDAIDPDRPSAHVLRVWPAVAHTRGVGA
ncbi:MAG TPA: HNH endonuclease signature motif containing protein [Acidimicrobiales bacterium]